MKIAFLTSGGNAPCLFASIGRLLNNYSNAYKNIDFIGYKNGFSGLLTGESIKFNLLIEGNQFDLFYEYGGSPIGNSIRLIVLIGS